MKQVKFDWFYEWFIPIGNIKGLEEVETLSRNNALCWPRSLEMSDYIRPYQ